MPSGGPARVGRPRSGADTALDERKAGAGGVRVLGWPVPGAPEDGRRAESCWLEMFGPLSVRWGREKAPVNSRRSCLAARRGCSFPSPLPRPSGF